MEEVIKAVELAFAEKDLKRTQMPSKTYIFYKKYNGDLRTMPSYLEGLDVSAVKIVNVHPDNRVKFNLPTVMATITLIDPRNGAPIAIMGGTWITNMRTGAAGGVATKYLARKDSKIVGFVGAGAQARTQLMSLLTLYKKIEEVRVYDLNEKIRDDCIAEMRQMYGNVARIVPAGSNEDAVKGADIVTTTTPSRKPIVLDEWVEPGMHFNCIGADAPGKQEMDPAILKRAKIVVDDWDQASHSGEINVPLSQGLLKPTDIWSELGEVVAGIKQGRTASDEITVFDATGLAILDAVTSNISYKKAMEKGIGQTIQIL